MTTVLTIRKLCFSPSHVVLTWCDVLISFIWVNSFRCTCLQHLVVIGHLEMELSILVLIHIWIPQKKLYSPPGSTMLKHFQNYECQFPILKSRESLDKGRKSNSKVLYFKCKRNNWMQCHYLRASTLLFSIKNQHVSFIFDKVALFQISEFTLSEKTCV